MRRVSLLRLWAVPLLWMWAVTRGDESAAAGGPENADLSPDLSPEEWLEANAAADPEIKFHVSGWSYKVMKKSKKKKWNSEVYRIRPDRSAAPPQRIRLPRSILRST